MFTKLLKVSLLVGSFALVACAGECGDGVIDEKNTDDVAEACDDGNAIPGDGCNAVCSAVESGFDCPAAGAACVQLIELCSGGVDEDLDGLVDCADVQNCGDDPVCIICGDGILGNGEGCDDENVANGDGCSSACQLEAGTTYTFNATDNDGTTATGAAAQFAVFEVVSFGGGTSTGFVVVISEDPDICNTIGAAGGVSNFQDSLFDAAGLSIGNGNDVVSLSAALAGANPPAVGTPVVGLGFDDNTFVDNFFINADGSLGVQSDGANIFTLTNIVVGPTQEGINMAFTVDAGSNFTDDISGAVGVPLAAPIPLTAVGVAARCPLFF